MFAKKVVCHVFVFVDPVFSSLTDSHTHPPQHENSTSVGDGKEPVKGQKIEAHYIGKLTNGKKFDASYDRGRPLPFNVGAGQVIKGWDLGILGADDIPPMKVGGKRRLLIPPQLGYGDRGAGGVIPGGATLDFEVELVKA